MALEISTLRAPVIAASAVALPAPGTGKTMSVSTVSPAPATAVTPAAAAAAAAAVTVDDGPIKARVPGQHGDGAVIAPPLARIRNLRAVADLDDAPAAPKFVDAGVREQVVGKSLEAATAVLDNLNLVYGVAPKGTDAAKLPRDKIVLLYVVTRGVQTVADCMLPWQMGASERTQRSMRNRSIKPVLLDM